MAAPPADKARTETKRSRQQMLMGPLLAYPFCLTGYLVLSQGGGSVQFWHGHPMLMLLAYVSLAGNAVTLKKVGGVTNTAWHGYLMFAASLTALAGSAVIWQNKENMRKEHMQTLHSAIGGATLMCAGYPVVSWILYNPYTGWKSKPMGNIWRTIHKYTGYGVVALSFAAMGSGVFQVTKSSPVAQAGFLGGLIVLLGALVLG